MNVPHPLCNSKLEDFTAAERALNCPFCLTKEVECMGNYHPHREAGQSKGARELFAEFLEAHDIQIVVGRGKTCTLVTRARSDAELEEFRRLRKEEKEKKGIHSESQ